MKLSFYLMLGLAMPALSFADSVLPGADLDQGTLESLGRGGDLEVRANYSYTFENDFDDRSLGALSVQSLNTAVRVPISLGGNLRLQTGVSYRRLDFDSGAELIPDQMQGLAALVGLEYLIGGQPVAGIRSAPGFYFIDDIDGDSFDAPTILYAGWRFNPSLIGIAGASYSGLRADNPVIPLAGFIWTISDNVKFNAILPVASLDFQVNDTTTFSVIGEYVGLAVHTGDSLGDAGYSDTSLKYSEMRAGAQLKFAVSDSTSFLISGGWAFRQEFEFDEPDDDFRTGGAPFIGVSLRTSF